jgi:bifunctional enzyme CysN/CysC
MKELLKFLTCGSVDDGKSTLIGRILYDAKLIFADQENALIMDSRVRTQTGELDYSLLLDGLMAEREQGITIDIAYRFFSTEKRSFIVADAPGHEEYTRNMAVGASFADLAVILLDAAHGIMPQTRRHFHICAMMGIRHFVFAVNKMDLVDYDADIFNELSSEIRELTRDYPSEAVIIPTSAKKGDNVTVPSASMPWYHGPALLQYLETVPTIQQPKAESFTMPVQRVCRSDGTFRGFQGEVFAGSICVGERIRVLPSKEEATVTRILCGAADMQTAERGSPVTIFLDREIDISRGCVLTQNDRLICSAVLQAELLWLDDEPLEIGRSYLLKAAAQKIPAVITKIKYKLDIESNTKTSGDSVHKNEIACCEIYTDTALVFDLFQNNRNLGGLILIDRVRHTTCACGMIRSHTSVSQNLSFHKTDLNRSFREQNLSQKAQTIWFTGLSGSGKSTLANALEKRLFLSGKATMLLDADNVRMGLNRDLGFTKEDRSENIRRLAETAKLMNDAGLIVLVSAISPRRVDRRMARSIIGSAFHEVYINTPLETCISRDVKGLYQKALRGEIRQFSGIDMAYEPPEHPDLIIDTTEVDVDKCVQQLLRAFFDDDAKTVRT